MKIGELTGDMNWGLLVVSDPGADFQQLPEFERDSKNGQPFITSADATVIKVIHGQDGPTTVRVWLGEDKSAGRNARNLGQCNIYLQSRILVVGDVLRDAAIQIHLDAHSYRMQINADDLRHPEEIDLVLTIRDDDQR